MTCTTLTAMRQYLNMCDEVERDYIQHVVYGDTSMLMQQRIKRLQRDRLRFVSSITNDMPIGTAFWDLCHPSMSINVSTYIT